MIKYTTTTAVITALTAADDQDLTAPFGDLSKIASNNQSVMPRSLTLHILTGAFSTLEFKELFLESVDDPSNKYQILFSTAGMLGDNVVLTLKPDGGRESLSPFEFDASQGLRLRFKGDNTGAQATFHADLECDVF